MRRPAPISDTPNPDPLDAAPLGGNKSEAMYRLQIGISGVVGILMLVGLASIIENRAKQVEADSVPEAAATMTPSPTPSKPDPLAEAGVVPNLPASPTPADSAAVGDSPPPAPVATATPTRPAQ
ncbi:hypothetical protein GRI58_01570 [Porphyrobacter algicida]|uniref:Uncharacterized protein n=1 Tax=Qipengyuania algicida TaxID=1836209 RepID=A0A845ADP6_9SPHN|nr:hypothetical protein [Qipengyuania algicida]MXP27509.1 hypothetical protein [Qipengyuania algicida]